MTSLALNFRRLTLALLLTLAVPLSAPALSISGLKNDLVQFLLEKVSVPGQFEVRARTVEDDSTGRTVLVDVGVFDARGQWFGAKRIALAWSPTRLLRGEVQIDQLEIANANLERLPEVPPAPPSASAAAAPADETPATWPRSPITTYVKSVALKDFRISAKVLPQAIAFDASGSAQDEGDTQQLELEITRRDAVPGSVKVRYVKQFAADVLELDVAADEAAGGLVAAATGLPADIPTRLRIDGKGSASDWQGNLSVAATDFIALRGDLSAQWQTRIAARLALALTPGKRLQPAARDAIGSAANLALHIEEDAGRTIRIHEASLTGAVLNASASGYLERDTGQLDLTASGGVDAQAARKLQALTQPLRLREASFDAAIKGTPDALSARGTLDVRGPAVESVSARNIRVTGTARQSGDTLDLALDIDAERPTSSEPAIAAVLGNSAAIGLRGQVDGPADRRVLTLAAFDITGAGLAASATGEVELTPVLKPSITYRANLADLNSFSELSGNRLAGAVALSGRLTGAGDELRARGEAVNSELVVNDAKLGTVRVTHDITLAEAIRGRIEADMQSPQYGAGRASTQLAVSDTTMAFDQLVVDLLSIKARGNARLSRTGGTPSGTLALDIASLAPMGQILGLPLDGRAKGDVKLTRENGGTAQVDLALSDIRNADMRLAEGQLDVSVSQISKRPRGRGAVTVLRGTMAALEIERASVVFEGPFSALPITVAVDGQTQGEPLVLRSAMLVDASASAQQLDITALTASFASEELTLQRPVRVLLRDNGVEIDGIDIKLPDGGTAQMDLVVSDGIITTSAKLQKLPLRLINLAAPETISAGTLDASLRARSAGADAGLDLRAQIANLRFTSAPTGVKALAGELDSQWDGRIARANFELTGPFTEPVKARIEVPLAAAERALPTVTNGAALGGSVKWRGDTTALLEQLPLPDHLLDGEASIDIAIGGTVGKPSLTGSATLGNGRYENLTSGTVLRDLTLTSRFDGDGGAELTVEANDGNGGTLTVKGLMRELRELDLRVDMRNLLAVRLDQIAAQVGGDLRLSGDLDALLLKGAITVERAEVNLLNQVSATVVDLGDVRIRGEAAERRSGDGSDFGQRVTLDIDVDMNDRIFVRGRGLESEWGGALGIGGTAARPIVTGKIAVRRGRFDLLGRILSFAKGELRFDGGREVDPVVDVRLEREANDIRGGVAVSGRASAPSINFYSTPTLPRDEILPRLLFGRASTSLSGAEALQLAAGIAALTTGQSASIDKIRSALGLDVLTVESGDSANSSASLAVGRYIRDGVYVGARQSLDGSTSAVVIEAEVFDNVVIDADVGQTGDTSVGVSWRKDF